MEGVGAEVHGSELRFGDLDAKRVGVFIEFRIHLEAGVRRCGPYCLDNRSEAAQWFSAPIYGDERKKAMLDLVPFACTRREVANCDRYSKLVS